MRSCNQIPVQQLMALVLENKFPLAYTAECQHYRKAPQDQLATRDRDMALCNSCRHYTKVPQ